MPIDYKKELENAARGMILVHDPDVLIKMVIRALVEKAMIEHASVLLYDPKRQAYVLSSPEALYQRKFPSVLLLWIRMIPLYVFLENVIIG